MYCLTRVGTQVLTLHKTPLAGYLLRGGGDDESGTDSSDGVEDLDGPWARLKAARVLPARKQSSTK